jgi:DNA-binding transcriptional ArsR family regulator
MAGPERDPVFDRAAELCALLSRPERLRIVRSLYDGERTFDELLVRTGVSQPDLLPHLNTLCRHGLVAWRHQGLAVRYRLDPCRTGLLARCLASQIGQNVLNFRGDAAASSLS